MKANGGSRRRACEGKKGFEDRDYARKAAEDMDRRYARPAGWFTAYPCTFCGMLHVGRETKAPQATAGRRAWRRP